VLAVGFTQYGDPDVLGTIELAEPAASPGHVVVRVVASTVNPTDTLMRAGHQSSWMTELTPPYIPGLEFAGYIHGVSEGSAPLVVGDPVMGVVNARRPEGGSHAQYISVPAISVAALPRSIDLAAAATIPMNGLTAELALRTLSLQPGDSLLVTGGAGAVGGYAIQLAKHSGLNVIADAQDSDVELLRELGADEIVPRGGAMGAAVCRLHCDGVHGAIDAGLVGDRAAALVRAGGAFLCLRTSNAVQDQRLRHGYVSVVDEMQNAALLQHLVELLADGILTPRVAVRMPMSEAPDAHRLVERGGLRGRVVLMFDR